MRRIACFVVISSWALVGVSVASAADNSVYKKKLTKNRAKKYEETGGKSKASGDLYIYADDKKLEERLKAIEQEQRDGKTQRIDIVSPNIRKGDKVRDVNIVIDSRKGIDVNRRKLGADKDAEVNVASPKVDKDADVRDVNVLVDTKRKGIKLH